MVGVRPCLALRYIKRMPVAICNSPLTLRQRLCGIEQTMRHGQHQTHWLRKPIPLNLKGTIVHGALKAFSYVVLGLMAIGVVYASYIGIKYWTGISV
jgi:hypothetical protein